MPRTPLPPSTAPHTTITLPLPSILATRLQKIITPLPSSVPPSYLTEMISSFNLYLSFYLPQTSSSFIPSILATSSAVTTPLKNSKTGSTIQTLLTSAKQIILLLNISTIYLKTHSISHPDITDAMGEDLFPSLLQTLNTILSSLPSTQQTYIQEKRSEITLLLKEFEAEYYTERPSMFNDMKRGFHLSKGGLSLFKVLEVGVGAVYFGGVVEEEDDEDEVFVKEVVAVVKAVTTAPVVAKNAIASRPNVAIKHSENEDITSPNFVPPPLLPLTLTPATISTLTTSLNKIQKTQIKRDLYYTLILNYKTLLNRITTGEIFNVEDEDELLDLDIDACIKDVLVYREVVEGQVEDGEVVLDWLEEGLEKSKSGSNGDEFDIIKEVTKCEANITKVKAFERIVRDAIELEGLEAEIEVETSADDEGNKVLDGMWTEICGGKQKKEREDEGGRKKKAKV